MAALIEFLRILRDETSAAVAFVHHTGHQGEHMRGSSDLESAFQLAAPCLGLLVLAADAEDSRERCEPRPLLPAQLGEDRRRPAVVEERDGVRY